jgi:hypothetical protein
LSRRGGNGGRELSVSQSQTRLLGIKEESMAKGQMRNNKEAKKPKSDKPKNSVSDYKKSQGATGQALNPPGKKS